MCILCWQRYIPNVRKKQIVWYWDMRVERWKRGKIMSVNKHYLTIRDRKEHRNVVVSVSYPVIGSAFPRPNRTPSFYYEMRRRGEEIKYNRKLRLMEKLDIGYEEL